MSYTTHELQQGTPEWLEYRQGTLNASDAGTVLGINPYRTRAELIREMATGLTKEIDAGTQRRFDDGHRFERLAMPLAEDIIGEPLSATTVSIEVPGLKRRLSASLDGATFGDTENVEHKTLSDSLAAALDRGELPEQYPPQMEQGMMITGATRCLFIASKWDTTDQLIAEKHVWYESNPDLRTKIIAAWKQAEADAENYQHVDVLPAAVGQTMKELPALVVQVDGRVVSSNLAEYKAIAFERINSINTDLQTDQDFENAKKAVTFCKSGEERLELVKSQALAQTVSIDELFRTVDEISAKMRDTRLMLDRTIKARNDALRIEIVQDGKAKFAEHVAGLNTRLGKLYMPPIAADFATAIKGKSSFEKMRGAVSDMLAQKKIEANEIAGRIQDNLVLLSNMTDGYAALFADTAQLVMKAPDDLVLVIKSRIDAQKAAEAKKEADQRERIRQEEEAKATAKAKAEADEAERLRLAAIAANQPPITLPAPATRSTEPATQPATALFPASPPDIEPQAVVAATGTVISSAWQTARDRVVCQIDNLTVTQLGLVENYIIGLTKKARAA